MTGGGCVLLDVSMGCAGHPQTFGQHSSQPLVVLQLYQSRKGGAQNGDLASCPRALCKQAIRKHISTALTCQLASAGADTWSCL